MSSTHSIRIGSATAAIALALAYCGCGSYSDPDDGKDTGTETGADSDSEPPTSDSDTAQDDSCPIPLGGCSSGQHTLRFESEDQKIRVHMTREYDSPGVGESSNFNLLRMTVERNGACTVLDSASLKYENSHHNWIDAATGVASGIRYQLTLRYDTTAALPLWRILLEAFEVKSGAEVIKPTPMTATGGPFGDWFKPWWLPAQINEIAAAGSSTWQDEAGESAPWIELFNPSSDTVDLAGYRLSNDPAERDAWVFGPGTALKGNSYLVVAADGEAGEGPLHTSFALSPDGGQIMLIAPNGVTAGERPYGAMKSSESFIFDWEKCGYEKTSTATPSAENPGM